MHIKIGDVTTLSVDNWQVSPDDRQSTIEFIGGVVVQDFGHVTDGDKISCNVAVSAADAGTIYDYWHNRILVNVTDESGYVYENLRVVVKKYSYVKYFPTHFEIELEFWRI